MKQPLIYRCGWEQGNLRQPEEDLQKSIVQLCAVEGVACFEFGKPGAHRRLGGILPEGWPDLLIIVLTDFGIPGYIHIELKTAKGVLSKDQIALHARLKALSCHVYTVRKLEDIGVILEAHGHRMRTGL